MKKGTKLLAVLALVLVLGASIPPAMAYFTGSIHAESRKVLTLGSTTNVGETFGEWTKNVTVANTQGVEVYVRVRAYAPDTVAGETVTLTYSGIGWSANGEWQQYASPVAAEQSSGPLTVTISGVPAGAEAGTDFHVVVVYESVPVTYGEDGNPLAADWSFPLDTGTTGAN